MKRLILFPGFLTIFSCICVLQAHAGPNLLRNASFEAQGSWSEEAYYWQNSYPDSNGGASDNHCRQSWRHQGPGAWIMAIPGRWGSHTSDKGYVWQEVEAEAGQVYEAGAWFFADDNWVAYEQGFKLIFYNDSGTALAIVDTSIPQNASFQWHSIISTAPVETATARIQFYATGIGTDGAFQFDEVVLRNLSDASYNPGPSSRRTCLVFSEIMYHSTNRTDGAKLDFIELYNTEPVPYDISGWDIEGEVDYTFPESTVIPANGYLVVADNPSAVEAFYGISNVLGPYSGGLGNSSGEIELENSHGEKVLKAEYSDNTPWPAEADGTDHSLVLRMASFGEDDVRAYGPSVYRGGTPGSAALAVPNENHPVINEFLAHTDEPLIDFIELYNPGSTAIDLEGYQLADDIAFTNNYVIPSGTTLPAGGFISFNENTLGFQLSSDGDQIYLLNPETNRVVDAFAFGGQQHHVSCGRYPDGAPGLHPLSSITEGSANSTFKINDVVINEIMYNPISGDNDDEYIELYNRGSSDIDISYWHFDDGIDFVIPAGTIIRSHSYIVIAADAENLIATYPVLNTGNTVGDYDGSLADGGEKIVLVAPDNPADPNDVVQYIVDEVTYIDGGYSRDAADGDGSSLELISPNADNDHMMNWQASDERSKSSWVTCVVTQNLSYGMLAPYTSINQCDLIMPRSGRCLIDNVEVIPSGEGNKVVNPTFESGSSDWIKRGNHNESASTTFDAYQGSRSFQLIALGGGDNRGNRVTGNLSTSLDNGETVTLRFTGRWLSGSPLVLLRILGNYAELSAELPIPKNLGTPGEANSCYAANTGPVIEQVAHSPIQPKPGENVQVTARVSDSDGIGNVYLRYRVDPSSTVTTMVMTQDNSGLYYSTIIGKSENSTVAFHVQATDLNASPITTTYPENITNYECLVRFDHLQDDNIFAYYTMWIREDDMTIWKNRTQLSNKILPITFVCRDRVIYDAGIRYRGSPFVRGAYNDPESCNAAFRIELPHGNRFLGSSELNLDWLEPGRDATYQRERCAYRIAYDLDMPAIYQRYITVCLYGFPRGIIYTDSQHPDSDYIESWYKKEADDGELFKLNDWFELNYDLYLDSAYFVNRDASLEEFTSGGEYVKRRYRWSWERSTLGEENDDYSSLFTLVESANLSGDDLTRTMESICDVEQWMATIAFRHALGDWDSFGYHRGKNMFCFLPKDGKFQLLNWDIDFGMGSDNATYTTQGLFEVSWAMPIMNNMIQHPPFKRYYYQTLSEMVSGPMQTSEMTDDLASIYNALAADSLAIDTPTQIIEWFSGRRSFINGQLYSLTNATFEIGNPPSITVFSNQPLLYGTAPIQDVIIKVNGKEVTPRWTSVTNWQISVVVTNGGINFVTVQGCDADGNPISGHSDLVQITYNGTEDSIEDSIVINEIMYNPADNGTGFIELYNRSANTSFDLYNCRLDGVDLTFTKSTPILPGQHLIVASDPLSFIAKYGSDIPVAAQWDGSLDNSGEWLRLYQLNELEQPVLLIDAVRYNDVAPWPTEADGAGCSLQLIDADEDNNRVGNWAADTVTPATPGEVNSVVSDLPAFPEVRINEVQSLNAATMADNAGDYDPWFELYNGDSTSFTTDGYYMTDDYTDMFKWALPNVTIAASGFQMIWADNESGVAPEYHANFILNTNGGNLALVRNCSGTPIIIDYNNYDSINEDMAYGCYPDGGWTNRQIFFYPTPGSANDNTPAPADIYINEWMAKSDTTEDWLELYNAEEYAVDITGYSLSDEGDPEQWTISDTVILQPREFRLVWADDNSSANEWGTNALHTNFKLGKSGETITFYAPNGQTIDSVTFGEQTANVSEGRYPDGATAPYPSLGVATPWAANILDPSLRSIAITCNGNGSMSPNGHQSVSVGSDLAVSITADPYFVISDILTNGISTGNSYGTTNTTYTWNNVTESGSIYVKFSPVETVNGTPHYWLAEYDLTNDWDTESSEDQDGDGLSTWQEYIAGTSPINSNSLFYTDAGAPEAANGFVLSWNSTSNRYYTIYRTPNLNEEASVIFNRMHAYPPLNIFTDETATVDSKYYYWIKVED